MILNANNKTLNKIMDIAEEKLVSVIYLPGNKQLP